MDKEQHTYNTLSLEQPDSITSNASSAQAKESWWERKIGGRPLAIMWTMTALAGAFFITMFGIPDVNRPFLTLVRLSLPIVFMVLYAWYGNRYVRSAGEFIALRIARVSQLADSLYFLGFLWTLWALIDSIAIKHLSIPEAVFRAFGYALVTTATGMFLRMQLLLFRYSGEDQHLLGERTIEEQISRFSKEMDRAIASITHFRMHTDTALAEWIDSLSKSIKTLKIAIDDVRTQTTELRNMMGRMHEVYNEHMGELIEETLNRLIHKIEPSLDDLNKANEHLAAEIEASAMKLKTQIDTHTMRVETAFNDGMRTIEAIMQSGATEIQSGLSKSADAISASIGENTQAIKEATAELVTTLSVQMMNLQSNLDNLCQQIQEIYIPPDIVKKHVTQQIDRINAQLEESVQRFQDAINHLSNQIQGIRIPADVVEKSVMQQIDRTTARLEESIKTFQNAINYLSKQIQEIHIPSDIVENSVAQQVSMMNTNLASSTKALQDAIETLRRSVLSVAQQIEHQRREPRWKFFLRKLKFWG